MITGSSKISFNLGQSDPVKAPEVEAMYEAGRGAGPRAGEYVDDPVAPRTHAAAAQDEHQPERFASEEYEAIRPAPVAPMYATAGRRAAAPDPTLQPPFVQRNAPVLAAAAIVVLTFMLGITTALLWSGGTQQAMRPGVQSEPLVISQDTRTAGQNVNEAVTRAAAVDLTEVVSAAQAPVIADLAAAVLEGLNPRPTAGKLTEGELAQKAAEAQTILNSNKLRMLREGVLAGVYTIETADENGQKRVKLRTINAKMTTDNIGSMLVQAAAEGRIEIPASLKTADGNVDIDTMMFNLVQTSLANDGTSEGAEAAREMSRRIFIASTVRSEDIGGKRTYIVEAGDSLAYISLQFYGKPSAFVRIFEANRDTLQSPDQIQIGQRLIIPS